MRSPGGIDLVALVSAIERLYELRLGDGSTKSDRHVRLRAQPRLSDAPGRQIRLQATEDRDDLPADPGAELRHPAAQPLPALELLLRGYASLVGPATPLPLALAEQASGPSASAERLRDFLDIFHHRLWSLQLRGLSRLRAPQASADAALWEEQLLGAAGLASPSSSIPRPARRQLLGLLLGAGGRPTPALLDRTLTIALQDLASLVQVHTRALAQTGARRPASTLGRLGTPAARLSSTSTGDTQLLLGARLSVRHGLAIELHGLTDEALSAFAEGEAGYQRVAELVELLAPPGTTWELSLYPLTRRRARLGSARLGRTWLYGPSRGSHLRVQGCA